MSYALSFRVDSLLGAGQRISPKYGPARSNSPFSAPDSLLTCSKSSSETRKAIRTDDAWIIPNAPAPECRGGGLCQEGKLFFKPVHLHLQLADLFEQTVFFRLVILRVALPGGTE